MINMSLKWYQKIIQSILNTKTNILFIIDTDKLLDNTTVIEELKQHYKTIIHFSNELQLRKILTNTNETLLIIFNKKQDIPYDLISTYATLEINLNEVFPLLNSEMLQQIPQETYQGIYEKHQLLKETQYERLSKEKTRIFIQEIPSSYDIKEENRIIELKKQLSEIVKTVITDSDNWGKVAQLHGELIYHINNNNKQVDNQLEQIQSEMNYKFTAYIMKYFDDLIYHPHPPINSHRLHRIFDKLHCKNALLCFDCMGFEEWNAIKSYLLKNSSLEFIEQYSFSMLPSETNYSSSALFAGLTPKEIKELPFVNTITWRNEEQLFKKSLQKKGIDESQIYFQRCIGPDQLTIENYHSFSDYDSVGIIFSFIDRFIHKDFLQDKKLVFQNIQHYLEKTKLITILLSLIEQDFKVYITADHGNIQAKGNGINVSKDLVDTKAKRYLIQERKDLLEEYKTKDSVILKLKNINGHQYLLLQTGSHMFSGKNEEALTHGGISVSEVIIPFIEVKKL